MRHQANGKEDERFCRGLLVFFVVWNPLEHNKRHIMGLASAALSELYRRMKPLGATHMTGGGDPFYEKIGFEPCIGWTFWEKDFGRQEKA